MIGERVGNYRVVRKLGEGAMGDVYLAEHPRIGRRVALKVLAPELIGDPEAAARLLVEARAASELKHPHIVDVFDFGELPSGSVYLAMELLEGRPLSSLLAEGALPLERALALTRDVLLALVEAHAHGIVHRDLKPDNVFVGPTVKVLDFGVAKFLRPRLADAPRTVTGALMGTPLYMSPEQCRGEPVDARADLYSLSVMLYQMLSGRLPFAASSLGELLLAHTTQAPPPLGVPSLPPEVERLVLRGLEKDPAQRWGSARELLGALAELDPATAHTLFQAAPPRRRWPLLFAAAVPLGLLLLRQNAAVVAPAIVAPAIVAPAIVAPAIVAPAIVAPAIVAPAIVAPAIVAPAIVAPTSMHLVVRTLPPRLPLRLDGAALPNPFDGHFPRDGARHRLSVDAPGLMAEQRSLSFDRDQEVELRLRPRAVAPAAEPTLQDKLITSYPGAHP